MPYINKGIVKRYKKKRKSKAKNPKQPYTITETVTVDLGNQSEYEHGQEVVIISTEDYEQLQEQLQQLQDQNQQLQEDAIIDPSPNGNVNGNVTTNDISKQLISMDNAAIKLEKVQYELDYYKSMAIDWNGALIGIDKNINILVDEVIAATRKEYNKVIDEYHREQTKRLNQLLATIETKYNNDVGQYLEYNKGIAANIDAVVDETNQQIRNTSTIKWLFNKNKINLQVPTSDLMQRPPNIEKLSLVNNTQVLEKLQSKPNIGHVDNMAIKQNLVNVPNLEALAIKSNSKK